MPEKKAGNKAPAKKPAAKKKAPAKKKKIRPGNHHIQNARKTMEELISSGHGLPPKRCVNYSVEIGSEICARLVSGESLNMICQDNHMPHKASVMRWIMYADSERVHPNEDLRNLLIEFREEYKISREMQAEILLDELSDISDDAHNDYMTKQNKNGEEYEVVNHEVVNRSKLRVETRKWLSGIYLSKIQAMREKSLSISSKTDGQGRALPLVIKAYDASKEIDEK